MVVAKKRRKPGKVLHRHLTQSILEDIRSGRYPLGSKLPSQAELMEKYGLSVTTVRQSISDLEKQGIIRTENGLGSFVSLQPNRHESISALRNFGLIFERTNVPENQPSEDEILRAFAHTCRQRQVRFLCIETEFDAHLGGAELVKSFEGIPLDGICVFLHSGENADELLAPLAREFIAPTVFFPSLQHQTISIDSVDIELEVGVRHGMKYLLGLGHRRIAYVGSHIKDCLRGDPGLITGGRWNMYSEELTNAGCSIDPNLLLEIPYGLEPNNAIAKRLIKMIKQQHVTAIFAENDWMARHIMLWLWQEGIHVPSDISILSMDDVSFARQLIPPLTTAACPYGKAAEALIEMIESRLTNPNRPIQRKTFPTELMIRGSIGPVSK